MRKELTATEVKSINAPGFYRAGKTLYLKVMPAGSKSWVQRLTIHGDRHDIGLGGYPQVSLARARQLAFQNREVAWAGGDPLAEKQKTKLPTFKQAAEKTFEANRARWRSEVTARNWERGMKKHVLPKIGELRVDKIGREQVLQVLTPIWTNTPEVARKQRNRIKAVLSWCQAHGFIEHNVAGEMIDGALPAMPAVKEHYRAAFSQPSICQPAAGQHEQSNCGNGREGSRPVASISFRTSTHMPIRLHLGCFRTWSPRYGRSRKQRVSSPP